MWLNSTNFAIKDAQDTTAGCILLPSDYLDAFGKDRIWYKFIAIARSLPIVSPPLRFSYFDEAVYPVKD
jgi:hypothetical protein